MRYNFYFFKLKVDCTKNANLCKRQNIDSYPSLLLFNNRKMIGKYQGARTIEDFTNYLSEMSMFIDSRPSSVSERVCGNFNFNL